MTILCAERIISDARTMGLTLTEQQGERLAEFGRLLLKWNRVYNLTSITSEEDVLTKHILDALSFVAAIQDRKLTSILDVGSGGGLPAIPLAIVREEVEVTMIDSVQKKTSFLQQVIVQLGLKNAKVVLSRIEDYPGSLCDAVTARAFATLEKTVSLTKRFLEPSGSWLLMKGKDPIEEIAELPSEVKVTEKRELKVPGLNSERCLIVIEPVRTSV